MKRTIALALAAISLASCNATNDTAPFALATAPSFPPPPLPPPASAGPVGTTTVGTGEPNSAEPAGTVMVGTAMGGTGEPISAGNRPAYCRDEVAGMYATTPLYVTTMLPALETDGSISINGSVDKGSEGMKQFKCRYDEGGRFVNVMAMTNDGE